jgi:hypothetical protein
MKAPEMLKSSTAEIMLFPPDFHETDTPSGVAIRGFLLRSIWDRGLILRIGAELSTRNNNAPKWSKEVEDTNHTNQVHIWMNLKVSSLNWNGQVVPEARNLHGTFVPLQLAGSDAVCSMDES